MISKEEQAELYQRNLQTWKHWDEIMEKQKEMIDNQPKMTEEEWKDFRESHKNPNDC